MKRIIDIVFIIIFAPLILPVFSLVALSVAVKLGRPIFFRQQRPGLNGNPFEMVKFRSMLDIKDKEGSPLSDEQRLTTFGRLLRSTSLDELPEFLNVLKGEMSLVGPRPLLMEYLPLYSSSQARRHKVLPGITGWAQVNGRNDLPWEERLAMDVWYVDNQSLWLDLRIVAKTVKKVLLRQGIHQDGHASVERFRGSDDD